MDEGEQVPQEEIYAGDLLMEWETDEYVHHHRSTFWYVTASVVGVGLIIYAIATANFLFAVIILMIGIITLVTSMAPPERIAVMITNTGLVIGEEYFEYKHVKDFSIAYDPPDVKLLYIDFNALWHPMIAIPLEEVDPNDVRMALSRFLPEDHDRSEERLTDLFRRLYKF